MSFFTNMMRYAADDDYSLARDLLALALVDGTLTEEEKTAIAKICGKENVTEEQLKDLLMVNENTPKMTMPQSRKEKENYLVKLIQMMGADGESATEEIFLLEMIASRMGLNRFQLMPLILLHVTHKNFPGDTSTKVLSSFMRNLIDPKGKSDQQNRENIAKLFRAIANTTVSVNDPEMEGQMMKEAFNRATQVLLENKILVSEFRQSGIDFEETLVHERMKIQKKEEKNVWVALT